MTEQCADCGRPIEDGMAAGYSTLHVGVPDRRVWCQACMDNRCQPATPAEILSSLDADEGNWSPWGPLGRVYRATWMLNRAGMGDAKVQKAAWRLFRVRAAARHNALPDCPPPCLSNSEAVVGGGKSDDRP